VLYSTKFARNLTAVYGSSSTTVLTAVMLSVLQMYGVLDKDNFRRIQAITKSDY